LDCSFSCTWERKWSVGWAAAYSNGSTDWHECLGIGTDVFLEWALAGRLLAPLVLSRAKENRLVMSGLVAAGGGVTT